MYTSLKKGLTVFLILIFCFGFFYGFEEEAQATSSKDSSSMTTPIDNMTFGQIEELLLTFMKNNGINYVVSSSEFTDYVFEQALGETDPKLEKDKNYFAFTAYFARYICALDEQQSLKSNYEDTLLSQISQTNFSTDSFKDKTVKQIRDKNLAEEAKTAKKLELQQDNFIAPFSYTGYSPSAAVSYAHRWVSNTTKLRNPAYPSYSADCTNYVSQCLVAGGIAEKRPSPVPSGIYATSSYWYCDKVGTSTWKVSTPWIRVSGTKNFHDYWAPKVRDANYQGDTTVSRNADLGDVVQIRHAGTLDRFHTTIVTKFIGGTACLSYHTTDREDYPISNLNDYAYDWSLLDFAS